MLETSAFWALGWYLIPFCEKHIKKAPPGRFFFIMQLMTAPGALVRQGPRGGVNTYTHLCGARGPLHQGPRGGSTHIQNYVGPGGPDTRDPGGSFIMQLRRGPGAPVRTGPRGGVKTYTGLGTGLARACQGLAKGLPRAGGGGGGGGGGVCF